jgi:putative ABC transport system permease protein
MRSIGLWIFGALQGVATAFDAIRGSKARAALTILGVAVGVLVVVVISAAVHGINESVARDFEKAGPTTFIVNRYPVTFEACDGTDDTCKWRHNPPLTPADRNSIAGLSSVEAATMRIGMSRESHYKNRTLSSTTVIASNANWTQIDHAGELNPGRSFTEAEDAGAQRVVVINDQMATSLFGESDPLDKMIYIGGVSFQVIGVYHYEASFLSGGNGPRAIVPLQAALRGLHASSDFGQISVMPALGFSRDEVIDDVIAMMRERQRLRPSTENTFAIITQDKLFEVYNKVFGMFFLVMIVLSAIGLVVGGVGVVAIMTISVTERTREIGLRKALGATSAAILWQFLVEAVTLTGIGAAIGLTAGMVIAVLIRTMTPVKASVPAGAIAAALIASAFTGVVFGILPATRASKLDPVDALRYE